MMATHHCGREREVHFSFVFVATNLWTSITIQLIVPLRPNGPITKNGLNAHVPIWK